MEDGEARVRIRFCPQLAVEVGAGTLAGRDLGSRKARTLLALLASERGRPVSLDRIVDALWPSGQPRDPAANVATLVSRTRRLLGPGVLADAGRTYGLDPSGRWTLDLDEAARLSDEAASRLEAEPGLAAAAAEAALELVGSGLALADESDAAWVDTVRRDATALRRRTGLLLAEALTGLDPAGAVAAAEAVVAADPYDEQAVRALIRASVADGRPAAALAAYDTLAGRLREELGTSPVEQTEALHLAVLRETALPVEQRESRPPSGHALTGREPELARLQAAWAAAGAPSAVSLVLVEGEAGIGKSRLLDAVAVLAESTGGRVLRGRCHPAERSLFLQPYLDALRPVLVHAAGPARSALVADHEAAWRSLLPELSGGLPAGAALAADVDLQRRQVYDAVASALRRLAADAPVLLTLDDLQDGGAATADLLGYLATRLAGSRVLLVAAVRAEDRAVADRLADRAQVLALGPLPLSAIEALAAAAGMSGVGEQVQARTAGHTLSVVEYLRALVEGDAGVPASLTDAVLGRIERLDATTRAVVEAAAVLRRRLEVRVLASLLTLTELTAARECETLVAQRLLARSGEQYEFANDLLQECIHDALPPALSVALHRAAADLTADRPEEMAEHAALAGDALRAARGWLLAGEAALRRAAVEDALGLLDRSLAVSDSDPGTRGRALLARAAAREAGTDFEAALADAETALGIARAVGDRRLEMAALRARGGDPAVARRLPEEELAAPLEAGLRLAAALGDRRAETDFNTRLVVLEASGLRLTGALRRALGALPRARSTGSEEALVLALDGLKTVWSSLADPAPLRGVVAELEPLVRARDDAWLLQWVVFESSFVPAAEGRWEQARARVREALEVNRRSGYPAYSGYMLAHDAWFARLAGDADEARRLGRAAVEETSAVRHPWWYAAAAGLLAATLVETGDEGEAMAVARRGLAATHPSAPAAGRVRCLAAVAALTDDDASMTAALDLVAAIDCPPGHAWVAGADAYLLVALAASRRGDRETARQVLAPLVAATERSWRPVRERARQIRSSTS